MSISELHQDFALSVHCLQTAQDTINDALAAFPVAVFHSWSGSAAEAARECHRELVNTAHLAVTDCGAAQEALGALSDAYVQWIYQPIGTGGH